MRIQYIFFLTLFLYGCSRTTTFDRNTDQIRASDLCDFLKLKTFAFSYNPCGKSSCLSFAVVKRTSKEEYTTTYIQKTNIGINGYLAQRTRILLNEENSRYSIKIGRGDYAICVRGKLDDPIQKALEEIKYWNNDEEGCLEKGYILGSSELPWRVDPENRDLKAKPYDPYPRQEVMLIFETE